MNNSTSVVLRRLFLLLFAFTSINSYAQTIVSGKITAADDGSPIPGANVVVKGTSIGTVSGSDGDYTIEVPDANSTLVFSFIGYVMQEIPVANRTVIDVSLAADVTTLGEVVVVGYGTQQKRDITGSVASVSSEDISKVVATDVAQAMKGRISGVNITQNSWNPGAGATVRIRGNRSVSATNEPLYVIDGVPISRGSITLNDINPSDVKSIEVLKDASATAIYGSRGANGVILVTTKRAETGRTSVTYNAYQGYQTPLNEPEVFSPAEYVEYIRESNRNSASITYNSAVPNIDEDRKVPQFNQDPYVLESVLMGYDDNGNWHPDRVRGYDWMDAISRTGVVRNHQLSVSKGTENMSILLAGGYFGNKGMVENMDYSRYNLRTNIDFSLNKRIRISGNALISRADENIGPNLYGAARGITPLGRPRDDEGNWIYYVANDPLMTNPLLDIDGYVSESRKNRILTNLNLNIDILEGLSFRGNFGYDYRTARDGDFRSSDSRERLGDLPSAMYAGNASNDYLIENLLFYEKKFNDDHDLKVTLLNSYQFNKFEEHGASVEYLPYSSQLYYNIGSASDILGVSSGFAEWQLTSWMARINYSLFDRYLFTLTGRRDGSSVLAPGNKHQFFPSAAVAWRMSDESFMPDAFDDLKLRISYGKTGNSAINPYQTQGALNLKRYVWDEDLTIGYAPGAMPNQDLRWEVTSQFDFGLDFGFVNNRITGTIDFYRANTSDLLMPRALPVVSGFENVLYNVGKTRNTGLEIALSSVNTRHESSFQWNTNVVFSANREEIVELVDGAVDDVGNEWFIGHPINVFYNYDAIGIWQNTEADLQEMALFNENGHDFEPGHVRIKDQNGDYRISADSDRVILGTNRPKWTASIANDFSFKNFDFSFMVLASYGAMGVYDQGLALNGRFNMTAVDYWTPTNPSNRYPKPSYDWAAPLHIDRTYNEDASFARLQYVTLGYTVPIKGINRCRFYVSAQNAFILTNYTGPDPEGAQSVTTPSPKTFMLGLDVSF